MSVSKKFFEKNDLGVGVETVEGTGKTPKIPMKLEFGNPEHIKAVREYENLEFKKKYPDVMWSEKVSITALCPHCQHSRENYYDEDEEPEAVDDVGDEVDINTISKEDKKKIGSKKLYRCASCHKYFLY